ncbi:hypothetical protein M9Y10_044688 [Tritrichomonas musculus]|uniref:PCI domain-containing protein n=1 Tax=Tritrichomonas musculus TaxID=1915356 RepID=A0ABR2JUA0_9EUKA
MNFFPSFGPGGFESPGYGFGMSDFGKGQKKIPEIIVQCKKVKNTSQLQDLGSLVSLGTESSESDIKVALCDFTLASLEKHQTVALILLIPPSFAPKELYNSFSYILDFLDKLPSRLQTGLALKWVRSAIFADLQNQLYDSKILHGLYEKNPDLYAAPYLYLCSAADHPISMETVFSGDVRINALTLYYSAINKMLLADYNAAEMDFIRALTLSKKNRDMKDSILTKLSLCSFLNRTPEEIFKRRIPLSRSLPKIANEIWKFDRNLDLTFLPPFYKRFLSEIAYEHSRGVILNLASTVTVIKLEEAQEFIGKEVPINVLLENLKAEGTLITTINEGYIYFNDTSKTQLYETKIKQVEQIFESLNV